MAKILLFISICISFSFLMNSDDLDKGIHYFKIRANGCTLGNCSSENINKSLYYLRKCFNTPNEKRAVEYFLRSCYFKATYCEKSKEQKQKALNEAKSVGEKMIEKYPTDAPIKFWNAVCLGAWAKESGVIAALKDGVIDKIRNECLQVIELNPSYEDGGAYRYLGILNLEAPYIPLLISWPSKEEAVKLFKKSLGYNPNHVTGNYYLAKTYNELDKRKEAIEILERITKFKPSESKFLENTQELEMSLKLLKELKSKK